MDNKNHFLLYGGFYAFGFSSLILVLLFIAINQSKKPTYFSLSDDSIMSISMQEMNDKATQKYIQDMTKMVKLEAESDKEHIEDADSLFDDVKTESFTYNKEDQIDKNAEVDDDFLKKLQVRTKIEESKTGSSITKHLNIKDAEQSLQNLEANQAKSGEKNEYYAKVHDILYAQWHPSSNKDRAVVLITISPSGRFSYKVRQWSGNEQFNKELESHLEYLKEVTFPLPPKQRTITLDINFISKENSE
ncbi:MAG: TonB C-terminal domain-containing protein [Thiovulaceae bacterium]|nr:TonB C-terminal domain-containing protein [Sulfurimonadaceae bacterium]